MPETVLCVDIGTTSLKAALITADGGVVSVSTQRFSDYKNRFIANRWIFSLKSALQKMQLKNCTVRAVAVSGNGPTVVSQSGMTLRWNEHVDYEALGITKEQTGSSLFLPRILAFKKLFNKDFEQNDFIFSGPEYLIYQLTDSPVTILPEARFESAYWDKSGLDRCEIQQEKLPPFVSIGQTCGNLNSDLAAFLQLPEGIPVIAGGPDFVVALIGTNTLKAGAICDRCGSSEGFNYCIPDFIQEEGVRSLPSVIPGLWNVSVLIENSSQLSEEKRFEFAKNAIYVLKGLSQKYQIDFPDKITVTGGQANNHKMMQEKADVLGIRLSACQCAHAELLGDACAGWTGLGNYSSIQKASEHIVKEYKIYESV